MMTLKEHMDISAWMKNPALFETRTKSLPVIDRLNLFKKIQETYPLKSIPYDKREVPFIVYDNVFDLVLGQFIMIEQIFTGKAGVPEEYIDFSILKIILRPKGDTEFDNTDKVKEAEHTKSVLDMDVTLAMSILKRFVDDRNKVLFNDFKGVFYDPDSSKGEEEEEESDLDKSQMTFEYKFKEQWYWYNIVRNLAGENILNYDKIYMLKMESVLPELSFLIQKAKIEKAQEFRNRVANKL